MQQAGNRSRDSDCETSHEDSRKEVLDSSWKSPNRQLGLRIRKPRDDRCMCDIGATARRNRNRHAATPRLFSDRDGP
jgi:hypothetical protein